MCTKLGGKRYFLLSAFGKKIAEMKGDKGDFVPKNKYLLVK